MAHRYADGVHETVVRTVDIHMYCVSNPANVVLPQLCHAVLRDAVLPLPEVQLLLLLLSASTLYNTPCNTAPLRLLC
jgi:hypothetical protein